MFREDIEMAEDIYELSVPYLQGKMVWHKTQHVEPAMVSSTPNAILEKYKRKSL